jgi:hypothetical protein
MAIFAKAICHAESEHRRTGNRLSESNLQRSGITPVPKEPKTAAKSINLGQINKAARTHKSLECLGTLGNHHRRGSQLITINLRGNFALRSQLDKLDRHPSNPGRVVQPSAYKPYAKLK